MSDYCEHEFVNGVCEDCGLKYNLIPRVPSDTRESIPLISAAISESEILKAACHHAAASLDPYKRNSDEETSIAQFTWGVRWALSRLTTGDVTLTAEPVIDEAAEPLRSFDLNTYMLENPEQIRPPYLRPNGVERHVYFKSQVIAALAKRDKRIAELETTNSQLKESEAQLKAKLAKATAALEKIADATSAFKQVHAPGRNVSYADWELRLIARDTLAEIKGGINGKS